MQKEMSKADNNASHSILEINSILVKYTFP